MACASPSILRSKLSGVARAADVNDPELRAGLVAAERLLDEGDYQGAVRAAVGVFEALIEQQPDSIVPPPDFSRLSTAPLPRLGVRRGPWPSHHGVQLLLDPDQRPRLVFNKERFTLSEAAAYVEYTLEAVVIAQRASS
jgi:hypothetical protein